MLYAITSTALEITEAVAVYTVKKTLFGVYALGCWAFSSNKQKIENIDSDYVLVQTDVINLNDIEKKDDLEKIINNQTELINDLRKDLTQIYNLYHYF